jgi:hypothetical protein
VSFNSILKQYGLRTLRNPTTVMTQYIIKVALSALIIVAISEIAKRSSFLGGLLASLPIVSFMAIIWLYVETKDAEKVAKLSINIFWLVLPSLAFFQILPMLLRSKINFAASFSIATAAMLLCYGGVVLLARQIHLI